jgi:ParB family transcriptional regulator, chromosome partitioning protein
MRAPMKPKAPYLMDSLGMDQTTLAHHLGLLALPPVLDDAMNSGRCLSPRTLHELNKLHAVQPERVAEWVAGNQPITRSAVAELRYAVPTASATAGIKTPTLSQPNRPKQLAQLLARANVLCSRLDAALLRLSQTDTCGIAADAMTALHQQVLKLSSRLDR